MNAKQKQFKDPVHGYISIREDWCKDFIDTFVFQRLRYIEQTSMRPLYPAARHDRFIHSLGTFHLGQRIYASILKNTQDEKIKNVLKEDRFQNTFLIACLMHDCGHAPFSHTLEEFFNHTDAETPKQANKLLQEEFPNEDFQTGDGFDPAPHEAFSAVVLNKFFADKLKKYNCDAELAARMITGCTYPDERDEKHCLANRLIGLLNGKAIDVDLLDYILRDTWVSGVQNTAIDIDRLVRSVVFHFDAGGKIKQCFHKSALSVLQNVVDARNYLYEWVYNHHTVLYYSKLLNKSMRKLAELVGKEKDKDYFWKTVFSLEPFRNAVKISNDHKVYLPADGDMLYLMKSFIHEIPEVEELLSHTPKRVALWKTYAEFRMLFKETLVVNPNTGKSISKRLPKLLSQELQCPEEDIIIISALTKHYVIEESHVFVLVDNEVISFTELMGDKPASRSGYFFYVFIPPEHKNKKTAIIDLISSLSR